MKTYNWGIIGLGKIARKFAEDLRRLPNARLHAVASTSRERAKDFAVEYKAPYFFGTYEDIVRCPDLDVVYVATPHVLHCENALLCLEHGIPVLCEKPLAMHSNQVQRMVNTARRKRTFLMEALWTRFIPAFDHAMDLIERGEIGKVHTIKADFGFLAENNPKGRLLNKELGGGALLDIGIYPVLLSQFIFGKPDPEDIQAAATFTATDVDDSCAMIFQFPGKKLSLLHATIAANTPIEAHIYGSHGSITLHTRWHHPQHLTVNKHVGTVTQSRIVEMPYGGWGYAFEAKHVMECLEENMVESPLVPLGLSEELMETLDAIREKIGLQYE